MGDQIAIGIEEGQLLFADWMRRLVVERGLGADVNLGWSDGAYTIGSSSGLHLILEPLASEPWVKVTASDQALEVDVREIVREAGSRVEALDLGDDVWWFSATMTEHHRAQLFNLGELLRVLGGQTRIAGWRRLGSDVLLEFGEISESEEGDTEASEQQRSFAPKASVRIHVRVRGPLQDGAFTLGLAGHNMAIAAAVCSFALGRPVGSELILMPFPTRGEELDVVRRIAVDPAIGTLARKGVPLDVWNYLVSIGGMDSHLRVTAAMRTFNSAIRQERNDVAVLLFVAAAECLATPFAPWKKERLTKRFIEFFDELIPDWIDEVTEHSDFERCFGVRRGQRSARSIRREWLESVYQLRSQPLHEGLRAAGGGGFQLGYSPTTHIGGTRRAICGEFAEAAIVKFLESPRSSLIGHPAREGMTD